MNDAIKSIYYMVIGFIIMLVRFIFMEDTNFMITIS